MALNISSMITTNILQTFSVIENTSKAIVLLCSARSNPSPSRYWWTGPIQSTSARLELNATRNVSGIYTCNANNTMTAYDGHIENGYIGVAYAVEILRKFRHIVNLSHCNFTPIIRLYQQEQHVTMC